MQSFGKLKKARTYPVSGDFLWSVIEQQDLGVLALLLESVDEERHVVRLPSSTMALSVGVGTSCYSCTKR